MTEAIKDDIPGGIAPRASRIQTQVILAPGIHKNSAAWERLDAGREACSTITIKRVVVGP